MANEIKVMPTWSDDRISVSNGQWTATLGWTVSGVRSETEALNAVPVREGASHPRSGYLHCKGLNVERESPSLFHVQATYQNTLVSGGGGGGGGGGGDVLDTAVRWRWHVGHQSVPTDTDAEGNAIVNSTGEPAANGVYREETLVSLTVARTEPYYDIFWALQYIDHVNEDSFQVAGITVHPLAAVLRSATPNEDIIEGAGPVRVEYVFEFKLTRTPLELNHEVSPWDYALSDKGFHAYYQDGADNRTKYGTLYGSDHKPLTTPARLNGSGQPINKSIRVSDQLKEAWPTQWQIKREKVGEGEELAYLLRYKKYPRAKFAELGF
ncbi:MAG: hypothetical protein ACM359_03665 [Bacillota bacterium]